MRFAFQILMLGTVALAVTTACSNGGYTPPPGAECAIDYNPANFNAPIDPNLQQGLSSNPTSHALQPGVYTFTHSDLIYQETTLVSPLQLDVASNIPQIAGQPLALSIGCVRNARFGMTGYSANAMVVSDITVNNDFSQVATIRAIGFSFDAGGIHVNMPTVQTTLSAAGLVQMYNPNPAFFGKMMQMFILQLDAVNFEIRASYTGTDGRGNFRTSVHMVLSPLPQTTAPAAKTPPASTPPSPTPTPPSSPKS